MLGLVIGGKNYVKCYDCVEEDFSIFLFVDNSCSNFIDVGDDGEVDCVVFVEV